MVLVQLNQSLITARSKFYNLSLPTFYTLLVFDTSSLHSNVQLLTSSLPPFYNPFLHPLSTYSTLSIDQQPFNTPSLHSNSKLHRYLLSTPPSYIPSLHTQHCRILYYYPPLTLHFCTPTLNFISTSSLHPLSISPLYILSIVGYCHGTAQLPLGSPPVRRQPILYDNPPLTLPLYTAMSNFISTSSLHPLSISPHYILNIVN